MATSAQAVHRSGISITQDDSFPPQTARAAEIEAIHEFLKGVLEPRGAIYVSAPITSGRTFLQWFKRDGGRLRGDAAKYRTEHLKHVVQVNRERVQRLVKDVRQTSSSPVIDPTAVGDIEGWTQSDYRVGWARTLERFVHSIVFADGWEYSNGCCYEFLVATQNQLRVVDERGVAISTQEALSRISKAIEQLREQDLPSEFLRGLLDELCSVVGTTGQEIVAIANESADARFKDAVLDQLAGHGNVAQFVSFAPDLSQRFSRILGYEANATFESVAAAAQALLNASPEGSVNVRSYHPDHPKSREFVYGLQSGDSALAAVRRLAAEGLYTIVNETIDINDGGVSGVAIGDLIEFAPGDTPRCVEKPGTAALPRTLGLAILARVYGFEVTLPFGRWRAEFSLHPLSRGYRAGHTILWELEAAEHGQAAPAMFWPNRFSRFLGDKTYGLLLADALGWPVPETLAVPRGLAPFRFGRPTGSGEKWLRTAPPESVPGQYSTFRGWRDPFKLLHVEDPRDDSIAAVLAQDGVIAEFSGAALQGPGRDELIIEGVRGSGSDFMVGKAATDVLPERVRTVVSDLCVHLQQALGSGFKIEWAFDGELVWIIQLQRSNVGAGTGLIIVPGSASSFRVFDVISGIDALRHLIEEIRGTGEGVILKGAVGITSHLGDLLRRSNIPSRIESSYSGR